MTTRVEIKNADTSATLIVVEAMDEVAALQYVKPGETVVAYVHSTRTLRISELQPKVVEDLPNEVITPVTEREKV